MVDFLLPIDYQSQCRCLHTTYTKHLFILSVFQCVESGCVHSQQPIADSSAQTSHIKRLILLLILKILKPLLYGFVGH